MVERVIAEHKVQKVHKAQRVIAEHKEHKVHKV